MKRAESERMKPILKYPGGKWRISDWIISHFPKHKVYLEPFFGSGAVFFHKEPSFIETINDLDGDIVNLFRVCREHPHEIATAINITPFARSEFVACYDPSPDPIERARRTLVRYHQSFGTSNSSKNTWRNSQVYTSPRCAAVWKGLPEIIIECCERLKDAQIENTNAVKLIQQYNNPNTLIYCDPPYLPETCRKNMYKIGMDKNSHIELLNALKSSKSKIILSGYDNDLYDKMLIDWKTDTISTTVQMGLQRTEKIWMNFEVGQLTFD